MKMLNICDPCFIHAFLKETSQHLTSTTVTLHKAPEGSKVTSKTSGIQPVYSWQMIYRWRHFGTPPTRGHPVRTPSRAQHRLYWGQDMTPSDSQNNRTRPHQSGFRKAKSTFITEGTGQIWMKHLGRVITNNSQKQSEKWLYDVWWCLSALDSSPPFFFEEKNSLYFPGTWQNVSDKTTETQYSER